MSRVPGGISVSESRQITKLSELLHEAAETHHVVYRIVDGDDPDWASWYADWLLDLSELPQLLDVKPVRSHLVHALVQLDRNSCPRQPVVRSLSPRQPMPETAGA